MKYNTMTSITYNEIVTPELSQGAIFNEEYHGFREDYLLLHCLLRKYKPASVMEIGTNMGTGTNIICNAVPSAKVYSLDLPTELAHISLQHPISEGKGDKVGSRCTFPFTQLRGDSLKFNYNDYPCEAYFIDGEHDYRHPQYETIKALDCEANLIVWHDADIPEVWEAITDVMYSEPYNLCRVTGTRIAFAVKDEFRNRVTIHKEEKVKIPHDYYNR